MAEIQSEDYAQGYADGVRDAAAWSAKHAADLVTKASQLMRAVEAMTVFAEQIQGDARLFHDTAQSRWAQWADRRNWPAVQELVANARAQSQAVSGDRPTRKRKRASSRTSIIEVASGPSLNLDGPAPTSPPSDPLTDEQQMRRAAGQAWRA